MGYCNCDDVIKIPYKRGFSLFALFIALLLATTSCVTFNDYEASQEYNADAVGTIDSHTSIGQSFISRRPRLNGITFWITVLSNGNISPVVSSIPIDVQVYYSPSDTKPVFSTIILAPAAGTNIPITIFIPPTESKPDVGYYLRLSTPSIPVQINGRNEDAYPHGQLYLNQQPIDADIAFRLSYDYKFNSAVQDINLAINNIWLFLPLLVVLWLPGWLLLEYSGLRKRYDLGEQTALSIGISLAIIPVIMLWTTVLKFRWTREVLFVLVLILVTLSIIRLILISLSKRRDRHLVDDAIAGHTRRININQFFPLLILFLIFLLTLANRFIMVRDMATPAWVDSVHHALITRLILQHGGFPESLQPYLDITPSQYHLGFHSIAAVFTWLSNISIDRSLLILGQFLNAITLFSVYLLAKSLTKSQITGLFAAIMIAFFTPMPAYYTSWSRYTELTGLIILPVSFSFISLLAKEREIKKTAWIISLGALTSAGLFMIHYRVVIFLFCIVLAYLLVNFPDRQGAKRYLSNLLIIFVLAVSSILLVFPWFGETVQSAFIPAMISDGAGPSPIFQNFPLAYLTSAFGKQTLVFACLGLTWGLIRLKRFSFLILIWVLLLFLFANLAALNLPGSGLISSLSVAIMLFMPISILGGYFIDKIINYWKIFIPHKAIIPSSLLVIFMVGWVSYLGSKQLLTIINPITVLSRKADIPAIEWINENIPEGETIVINPFPWGYGIFAGSDGGYWITPLTGRQTLPPPVLYGLGNNVKKINDKTQKIIDLRTDPHALLDFLNANDYQYIYLGSKGGLFSPKLLDNSGLFTTLYHHDGVWIFSTKP